LWAPGNLCFGGDIVMTSSISGNKGSLISKHSQNTSIPYILQHTGSTTTEFKTRLRNHKPAASTNKKTCEAATHLNQSVHNSDDSAPQCTNQVAVSDDSQDHQGSILECATAHSNTTRPEQKARIPLHKQDKP